MPQPTFVHIGYHKTATNWFQRLFYPAVRNFKYVHRKRARLAFTEDHAFQFDPAVAFARLETPAPEGLILCEEELSGNLHNGGLHGYLSKEVAHRIKQTLPGAEVIIFIRSQTEMIGSVYKQYVKEGGTHSPRRYLFPYDYLDPHGFSPKKSPLFAFQHYDYRLLIDHYRTVFGPEKVHVFLYEEFSRNHTDFMARYIERFGFDVDLAAAPNTRLNVSNKKFSLWVARMMNRFAYRNVIDKHYFLNVPGMYRLRGRVVAPLLDRIAFFSGPARPRDILGPDIVRHIEDYYRASNRLLAEQLDLPLAQHGYPV
ncbi:MAG: hypothetical protein J0M28_18100 [Thauera sp.]|nr:hypothetical protein [Thauera sp.]